MPEDISVLIVVLIIIVLFAIFALSGYRKCPPGKIMVVYGLYLKDKSGAKTMAKCIHGGSAFIMPIFQSYKFLDLTPIPIHINLSDISEREDIKEGSTIDFKVAISTEPDIMMTAAERLLGIRTEEIENFAKDIIIGQLRLAFEETKATDLKANRDKLLKEIVDKVETELKIIGLRIVSVNLNLRERLEKNNGVSP